MYNVEIVTECSILQGYLLSLFTSPSRIVRFDQVLMVCDSDFFSYITLKATLAKQIGDAGAFRHMLAAGNVCHAIEKIMRD